MAMTSLTNLREYVKEVSKLSKAKKEGEEKMAQ